MTQTLLHPLQVAALLGVSVRTLKEWRARGCGPKFVRAGLRLVRYHPVEVGRYIRRQTNGGGKRG